MCKLKGPAGMETGEKCINQSVMATITVSQCPRRTRGASTPSTNPGTFITLRAAPSTPTTRATGRIVRVIHISAPSARTDSHRDTLYHASVVVTSGVHTVVD